MRYNLLFDPRTGCRVDKAARLPRNLSDFILRGEIHVYFTTTVLLATFK